MTKYKQDPEKYKARVKAYYEKNSKKIVQREIKRQKLQKNLPKYRFIQYKRSAKVRKVEFLLSYEEFMNYWQVPCSYCGEDISRIGLDRINNTKGYTLDNIVSCCKMCNIMKNNQTKEVFIERCKRITNIAG